MSTETRQGQPRYWCHICNAEVNIYMAPDPTCQQCNGQFVEELQADDDPREFLAGADNHGHNMEGGNIHLPDGGAAHIFSYSPSTGRFNNVHGNSNGEMGDDIFQYFTPRNTTANNTTDDPERSSTETGGGGANNASPLGNIVQNLLTNILGQNVDINGQMANAAAEGGTPGTDPTRPMMFYGSVVDGNMRFQPMPGMPGAMPGAMPTDGDNDGANNERGPTEEGAAGTGAAGARGNNIAGILQFLSAMTGAPLDVGLYGNPNDYVFSQNALDNIITQLMEQTGGASAPPPAPEQVIEALKKRSLTEKEKSSEADCAVCKDQFESHETVIELPCEHIFHDDCIKPWLKLNSTCPVCRHSVLPEQESANGQNSNNDSNNGTNDNHNTQNTQPTREANDGNNSTGSTASYTWVSGNGGGNGTAHQGMPTSFPVNLATAFPSWINNLTGNASRSNSTSTATNTNTTSTNTSTNTNTSTTTNSNENTNSNTATFNNATSNTNTHLDDDLDLD